MKKRYLLFLLLLIPVFLLTGCGNDQSTGSVSSSSLTAQHIFLETGIDTGTFTVTTASNTALSVGHGLKEGDMLILSDAGGANDSVPTPLVEGTVYYPRDIVTDSFKFADSPFGGEINLTDTGSSTLTWIIHDIGKTIYTENFRNALLAFSTDGGGDAALTVKFQGSVSSTTPDFSASQSVSNQWEYIQVIDLEDGSSIDGDTGVAVSGADDYRLFEMNINHLTWVNAIISGYTEGELTLDVKLKDNE